MKSIKVISYDSDILTMISATMSVATFELVSCLIIHIDSIHYVFIVITKSLAVSLLKFGLIKKLFNCSRKNL